jgi:pimeloyl-ACP methyl ester carboxylesterase
MRRDIVEIPLGNYYAVGTVHAPVHVSRPEAVVLLNAGHVPRNGHGGLAMHLAEHLCARGWPVLRADLPGLGDSPGPLPERIETFWLALKDGGHAAWAAEVARWARRAFSVERTALGGVCGASVTSVFAADRHPDAVDSLLLIEPELFTSEPLEGAEPAFPGVSGAADVAGAARATGVVGISTLERDSGAASQKPGRSKWRLEGLTSSWVWMRLLSRRRGNLRWLGMLQRALLRMPGSQEQMPDRANMALVEAWSRVSRRKTPMLVLTAEGLLWETYFWKLSRVLMQGSHRAVHRSVPGANHVFSNGVARAAVLENVPTFLESLERL